MAINFFEIFQNLGLSQTETKTYFASFQLGPSSIQEIAKRAKLSRTAVYDAVLNLQKRGILSTVKRGKKTIYSAEDPERVIAHFKSRMRDMEEQIGVLESAQMELSLLGGGERPTVRFYEGNDAIPTLFADIAKSGANEVREITDLEHVDKQVNKKVLQNAKKAVAGKNIRATILHRGTATDTRSSVKWYALPDDVPEFKGDMWIYGNRVAFFDLSDKTVSVIIENSSFAQTARVLFDAALRNGTDKEKKKK